MEKKRFAKPDFNKKEIKPFPATKFFDQLSFIGNEIVGCFVLETTAGYVLIDCMNPDEDSKKTIEEDFKSLGYDINNLSAIVRSHGHGDHFGNAGYFKEKYGAKIFMSKLDCEFAKNMSKTFPWEPIKFEVDHYLTDGETLEFGQIKCVFTPGHSVGCFSFIIPVTDEGRKHKMALWGGFGILLDTSIEDYENSWYEFSKICDKEDVDSEIDTHSCLDMGLERLSIIRNITNSVYNPFIIGKDGYKYYEKQFYNLLKMHKHKKKVNS